jgi:hypothetical protein
MTTDGCPFGFRPAAEVPIPNRKPFPADTFRGILAKCQEPSDDVIEKYAKKKIADFLASSPTDQQVYDFMARLRIEEHCSINSFMSQLLNVEPYYLRPE